jgi:hypothetical protein
MAQGQIVMHSWSGNKTAKKNGLNDYAEQGLDEQAFQVLTSFLPGEID